MDVAKDSISPLAWKNFESEEGSRIKARKDLNLSNNSADNTVTKDHGLTHIGQEVELVRSSRDGLKLEITGRLPLEIEAFFSQRDFMNKSLALGEEHTFNPLSRSSQLIEYKPKTGAMVYETKHRELTYELGASALMRKVSDKALYVYIDGPAAQQMYELMNSPKEDDQRAPSNRRGESFRDLDGITCKHQVDNFFNENYSCSFIFTKPEIL